MTATDTDRTGGSPLTILLAPSFAEGWSRLISYAGMFALAGGHIIDSGLLVWGSVVALAVALTLNTTGKLRHYWGLSVPGTSRRRLSVSWVLMYLTVLGLLLKYAHARFGPGSEEFIWPLAVAGFGFALLHMAAQSLYLPENEAQSNR